MQRSQLERRRVRQTSSSDLALLVHIYDLREQMRVSWISHRFWLHLGKTTNLPPDRKPIDPPPVVQLHVNRNRDGEQAFLQSTQKFLLSIVDILHVLVDLVTDASFTIHRSLFLHVREPAATWRRTRNGTEGRTQLLSRDTSLLSTSPERHWHCGLWIFRILRSLCQSGRYLCKSISLESLGLAWKWVFISDSLRDTTVPFPKLPLCCPMLTLFSSAFNSTSTKCGMQIPQMLW